MKKSTPNIFRLTAAFCAGALLSAAVAGAADAPAENPAPPNAAPAAPAPGVPPAVDNGANGGRQGRRGNAQGGNIQTGRGNPASGPVPAGGFNLDEKQRELFREAMQNESEELRKLNDKLQTAQKELVQAVVAEKYDEPVVRQKAEAVSKIQTDITMLRAKAFSPISPTLKPEQREQLDQNWRFGLGYVMGGGFGGGGNFQVGNVPGGARGFGGGGGPGDATQGGLRRRDGGPGGGANGGAPDQPRRRGGPVSGQ
jgi:Spy/CpxP family protein refolding chaperone